MAKSRSPVAEPHRFISIRGAREHNLKNVDLDLPRDRLVVITGLSGSGKSSLAFDTIYAEGQRRYVESLSAYARQFLELMQKPDVDSIEGLSPAISIEQKTTSRNPRSTVGTVTEIYDYLRLLVRPRRRALLAGDRPADREPDRVADGRPHQDDGRRHAALPDGAHRARPQGRVPQGTAGAAEEGIPAGQDRRQALRDRRGARRSTRSTSTTSTSSSTASSCGPTSATGWPIRSRPRSISPRASLSRRTPTTASARSSRRASPARSPASPSRRSSRGCSPSTRRRAPARPAMASA